MSSLCNDILNLNFTKERSNVIRKLPSASVNPENQNKKSSDTPASLKVSGFDLRSISDFLL